MPPVAVAEMEMPQAEVMNGVEMAGGEVMALAAAPVTMGVTLLGVRVDTVMAVAVLGRVGWEVESL